MSAALRLVFPPPGALLFGARETPHVAHIAQGDLALNRRAYCGARYTPGQVAGGALIAERVCRECERQFALARELSA